MPPKLSLILAAAFVFPLGEFLSAAFTHAAERPVGKPNVIFLMDDQHRWDALGIVNSIVKTPNLDALAKSGVFYDQAVCQAPMCIPSRNSMMLGLYPNQIGVLRNGRGIPDAATALATPARTIQGCRISDSRFWQDTLGSGLFNPWFRNPLYRRVSRRRRCHDDRRRSGSKDTVRCRKQNDGRRRGEQSRVSRVHQPAAGAGTSRWLGDGQMPGIHRQTTRPRASVVSLSVFPQATRGAQHP